MYYLTGYLAARLKRQDLLRLPISMFLDSGTAQLLLLRPHNRIFRGKARHPWVVIGH